MAIASSEALCLRIWRTWCTKQTSLRGTGQLLHSHQGNCCSLIANLLSCCSMQCNICKLFHIVACVHDCPCAANAVLYACTSLGVASAFPFSHSQLVRSAAVALVKDCCNSVHSLPCGHNLFAFQDAVCIACLVQQGEQSIL